MVTTDAAQPYNAVSSAAIQSIVAQVWEALFESTAVLTAPIAPDSLGPDAWTASVEVFGAWEGAVSLTCSAAAGEEMTRLMLGLTESDELDPLDLGDALGELVNVVGGNLKSLVDGCTLGLPQVGPVTPWLRPPLAVLHIGWGAGAVCVAVHDRQNHEEQS